MDVEPDDVAGNATGPELVRDLAGPGIGSYPDLKKILPADYQSLLDRKDTQRALFLAKRNIDTTINDAPFVVGLGPGFTAGVDCHAVIETMRGHFLGRVIWDGTPTPNTGEPGLLGGKSSERVVRAPTFGILSWKVAIADVVAAGDVLGDINGVPVRSRIGGFVRGLLPAGYEVEWNWKIGDIDPRADSSACFEISDKSLAIGGGVVEAILTWLGTRSR